MKAPRNYRPDLRACELEDRLLPVIANLGVIALTTSGLSLVTPFPGAVGSASGSPGSGGGSTGTAASVSGAAIPTSLYITGRNGISTFAPGNITGNPAIGGATTGPASGPGGTIQVGSGADDASAPIIPPVTRNTIVNDAVNAAPVIGGASGDRSAVLPPGQSYRDGVPVNGPAGVSTKAPGPPAGPQPDEKPADPLRIRLRKPPHRLIPAASGNLVESSADRAP
jgi:hypothetical protein